ncbi:MAG: UbiD family decarboxylase, partial [Chloroflexota bacterium]
GFGKTMMQVVSLKQRYAGHAKQALLAMAGFRSGSSLYRYYIVVDDDIDPSDLQEVVWAISTRSDPGSSVDIIHDAWTSVLDPRLSPEQRASGQLTMGRLLIDACKPFAWRDQFPKTNAFGPDMRRQVSEKWRTLLDDIV